MKSLQCCLITAFASMVILTTNVQALQLTKQVAYMQHMRPGATLCVAGYVMDENRIDLQFLPNGELALQRPNLYPVSDLVDDEDSVNSDWWILNEPAGGILYSKGWKIMNNDIVVDLAREVGLASICNSCYGGGTLRQGFKIEASGMVMSLFPPTISVSRLRIPDRTGQIAECAWYNSEAPTDKPTERPTPRPTNGPPTRRPTPNPTNSPTSINDTPPPTTATPTSAAPTKAPTPMPTPTPNPTRGPTKSPTNPPTRTPTRTPTRNPTQPPTRRPTNHPTPFPTNHPTRKPTNSPTPRPSPGPTDSPSRSPSRAPSVMPSFAPTETPPINCSEYQETFKVPDLPIWVHYVVNLDNDNQNKSTLSAQVVYDGQGWLGFGISPNGEMNGSSVIIGSVAHSTDFINPGKFYLGGRGTQFINVMEKQTLEKASIVQNATHTVLTFTKLLQEEGEPTIDGMGTNKFIAAYGFNNQFAYHAGRTTFNMALTPCISETEEEEVDLFDHLVYVNHTNATNTTEEDGDPLTIEAPEAFGDEAIPFEDPFEDTSQFTVLGGGVMTGRNANGGGRVGTGTEDGSDPANKFRDATGASAAEGTLTSSVIATTSAILCLACWVLMV